MTTTDAWTEANAQGTVHLHRTMRWVLAEVPSALHGSEWRLFGPGAPGDCMAGGGGSPALDLLLASRAADAYIAEIGQEACPLCDLRGAHGHWPHALEIHGAVGDDGEPATLRLLVCLACRQPPGALSIADPCPALLKLRDER